MIIVNMWIGHVLIHHCALSACTLTFLLNNIFVNSIVTLVIILVKQCSCHYHAKPCQITALSMPNQCPTMPTRNIAIAKPILSICQVTALPMSGHCRAYLTQVLTIQQRRLGWTSPPPPPAPCQFMICSAAKTPTFCIVF